MPRLLLVAAIAGAAACARSGPPAGREHVLTLLRQPLWGDEAAFDALLEDFRRQHPDVVLRTSVIPSDSDVAHQVLLTALEGGSTDFDVMMADVVWVPELARAGWVADLSAAFPPQAVRRDYWAAPAEVATLGEHTWAVPWFIDVGLLYLRTDLVPRAPHTPQELVAMARAAMERDPALQGFVWQGRQYEGLVCNAFEAAWAFGATDAGAGRLLLDTPSFRDGLAWLRGLVASGVSPPSVTSAAEEETRRTFQSGKAVFLRNWPYAWKELQGEGSAVRGRVAVAALPGGGALGGWYLAVNAHADAAHRRLAAQLVAHLTSAEGALVLAGSYGRLPGRRDVYADGRLAAVAPFLAGLEEPVRTARPRPVTPYYLLLADTLQSELSAAVVGVRTPAEALGRAQAQADRIVGAAP
jgi:multiple sugar transport system substrate-binding protein